MHSQRSCWHLAGGIALATFAVGCTGWVDDAIGASDRSSTPDPANLADAGGRSPDAAGYGDDRAGSQDRPSPSTRLARLTHTRWVNTVQDLFLLEDATPFADGLRPDPVQGGFLFSNDTSQLAVDEALWHGYQRAAADVARYVTEAPARLAGILPAGTSSATGRARSLVRELGRRAHRRPLTDTQIDQYVALHTRGAALYPAMDPFEAGVRLLIEAFLQSPFFLYHLEVSTEAVGGVIPLDDYEIASRLSYMLWDTLPDETLFHAAAAGELRGADQVAMQAQRMVEDARAEGVVAAFHQQLLDIGKTLSVVPSPTAFPEASPQLGVYAARETALFVQDLFLQNGGYTDLLTSPRTFVNDELARVYGLSGNFTSEFEPVSLPTDQRSGVLTQVGFLAANATSTQPDPIHRGAFVAERIACIHISAPPDDIPPLPPQQGRTNRETIEDHTEQEGTVCATCHTTLINPFGFPFEHYDAIGQYRTEDNGWPVVASTEPLIGDMRVPIADAVELAAALAASEQVHECYAKHWLEFAYGRKASVRDRPLISRLGSRSHAGDLSIKQLIIHLVRTEAFLTRSLEELP